MILQFTDHSSLGSLPMVLLCKKCRGATDVTLQRIPQFLEKKGAPILGQLNAPPDRPWAAFSAIQLRSHPIPIPIPIPILIRGSTTCPMGSPFLRHLVQLRATPPSWLRGLGHLPLLQFCRSFFFPPCNGGN